MGLLTKDVRIAEGLARAVELDAPVSRLVKERWEAANSALGEGSDHSEAIKSWDKDL
jgi:3-hydroxyisobutyrate dehydrogenase